MSETYILIDIRAESNVEILTCVRETFKFMPGWSYQVYQPTPDARFFKFDLSHKTFTWLRNNESFSETMDEDEIVVKDLADISNLLEFIHANTENLRGGAYISNITFDGIIAKMKASFKDKYAKTKIDDELYGTWDADETNDYISEIQGLSFKKSMTYMDELMASKKIHMPLPKKQMPFIVDYSFSIGHTPPVKVSNSLMEKMMQIVQKSNVEFVMHKQSKPKMNDHADALMSLQEAHWSGE